MGSNGVDLLPRADEAGGSEATIEIKIKTLDSQTYTLRVDKQVPVPALKEQIASVTGVLSDQQRLICRGKVLKDDQLLSAYHVEDGHTLHLVVRQPFLPSSEGLSNHSATDPALSTSRGQSNQVAPGLVIEAFSAVQGDSVPPEINRIVSAVLGSFGITNVVSGGEGTDVREHGAQNPTQLQSEQLGLRGPPDRSHSTYGLPAVSLGTLQPPVIHDSLTTLSQYLSLMRREFGAIVAGRGGGNSAQAAATHGNGERGPDSTLPTATVQEGFPTPASLAEVMLSTRQMLIEHAGECILQLARQLEDQVNVTDPSVRLSTQSDVRRAGFLIHNLGALLLELGRTTMTLRLGQTPSEAVVNAGPAVFISPSGPNPIMVQPLPFQPGTSLGAIPMGGVQPGSGLVNGLGTGFVPRRIDIQIRRGSSATTPNVSREEPSDTQQPFGPRNSTTNSGGENPIITSNSRVSEGPSFGGESGVQVVPTRTMIAAVPGPFSRLPSDSAGNLIGLYYPVLGRFQHVASGLVSGEQGSQATGERHSAGLQTEQRTDSAAQQHNIDGPARDESFPTPYLRQQEPSNAHSGNINILSADGTQNSQESDGHLPNSVMQFLRTLFPGGEIHVEEASSEGTGRGSVSEHVGTSGGVVNAPEAEPRASDEGIFLSNLLHQIIPLISEQAGAEPDARPTEAANASENTIPRDSSTQADSDVGTSRRPNDGETSPPNSKRLKME